MDRIATFWSALEQMTVAEVMEVAEVLRYHRVGDDDFDDNDARDWTFLLENARQTAQSVTE